VTFPCFVVCKSLGRSNYHHHGQFIPLDQRGAYIPLLLKWTGGFSFVPQHLKITSAVLPQTLFSSIPRMPHPIIEIDELARLVIGELVKTSRQRFHSISLVGPLRDRRPVRLGITLFNRPREVLPGHTCASDITSPGD